MNEVDYKVSDKLTLRVTGETHMDIFTNLADLQEVFDQRKCARCNGTDLQFVVRKSSDAKGKQEFLYPELRCNNSQCRAKLSFGQLMEDKGKLFPVRWEREGKENVKDADGKNIPRGKYGWVIYNKETGKEE